MAPTKAETLAMLQAWKLQQEAQGSIVLSLEEFVSSVPDAGEVDPPPLPEPMVADFEIIRISDYAPTKVHFENTSTGPWKVAKWDFGNDHESDEPDTDFAYQNKGRKPVSLIVGDGLGNWSEPVTKEFSLLPPLPAEPAEPQQPPAGEYEFPKGNPVRMVGDFSGLSGARWSDEEGKRAILGAFKSVDGSPVRAWGSEAWEPRHDRNLSVSRPAPGEDEALCIRFDKRTPDHKDGGGCNLMIQCGFMDQPAKLTGYEEAMISFDFWPDPDFSNAWKFDDAVAKDKLKGVPFKFGGIVGGLINGVVGRGNGWSDGQGHGPEPGQLRDNKVPGPDRGVSVRFQATGRWDDPEADNVARLKPIWGCADPRTYGTDDTALLYPKDWKFRNLHYGLLQPEHEFVQVQRGAWNNAAIWACTNEDGKPNGKLKMYVNGQLIHSDERMTWRRYRVLFHTFWMVYFFGGDAKTNERAGAPRNNRVWIRRPSLAGGPIIRRG